MGWFKEIRKIVAPSPKKVIKQSLKVAAPGVPLGTSKKALKDAAQSFVPGVPLGKSKEDIKRAVGSGLGLALTGAPVNVADKDVRDVILPPLSEDITKATVKETKKVAEKAFKKPEVPEPHVSDPAPAIINRGWEPPIPELGADVDVERKKKRGKKALKKPLKRSLQINYEGSGRGTNIPK